MDRMSLPLLSCDWKKQTSSIPKNHHASSPGSPEQPRRPLQSSKVATPSTSPNTHRTRRRSLPISDSPKSTAHSSASFRRNSQQISPDHIPARPSLSLQSTGLARHGTLLTTGATPARAAAELESILGNHNARLKPKAALIRVDSGSAAFNRHVTLEQAKLRPRVEVDILPQSNVCVQGSHLRGHIRIIVRQATRKETPIFIAGGKIRIIGFESLGDKSRSIFYQCSAMLASITPTLDGLYASEHDEEGFAQAREGEHEFPFALYLSLSTENGQARGSLKNQAGFALNYIAMISLKLKDEPGRRSIAHFYRAIEVWPRLDPTATLTPALRPIQATMSSNISKGSKCGRIKLTALLHRLHWVAGQRCQVLILIDNDTDKQLRELTISLHRTTTIFPHSSSACRAADLSSRKTDAITSQVAESSLEVGQPGAKGHASARGWWLGVRPRGHTEFEHSILIPMDALTVPRGLFFEVEYSLRITINSVTRLSSEIQVMLPIRVVSFLSIDPPPSQPAGAHFRTLLTTRSPYTLQTDGMETLGIESNHNLATSKNPLTTSERNQDRASEEVVGQIHLTEESISPEASNGHILREKNLGECCSGCADGLGDSELGNLSLVDDTDDVVHHAITTARVDLTYGGFSDLYYTQNRDNSFVDSEGSCDGSYEQSLDNSGSDSAVDALMTLMEEVATQNESNPNLSNPQLRWNLSTPRRSSFVARVEKETRRVTTAFLNGDPIGQGHQERREEPSSYAKEGRRIDKPHLRLKISPVLDGANLQSPRGPINWPEARSRSPEGTFARLREKHNGYELPLEGGILKSHSKQIAANPNSSLSATSSHQSCSLATPPDHRKQDTPIVTPAPLRIHCSAEIVDSNTHVGAASPASIVRLDTRGQTAPHANVVINSPRAIASTLQVRPDLGTVRTSDTLIISPESATSHTSAASSVTISVKDKVRRLEERAKAVALT